MKRTISLMIAMVLLGTMVFAEEAKPVPVPEMADETVMEPAFEVLQNGSRGEMVEALQAKLKELGYKVGLVDGIFGWRTRNGLKKLQEAMGLEQTGMIENQEELDTVLNAVKGNGVNMVWDGRFTDRETYWSNWGKPTLCEIVKIDGQNWMHLISSGTHWEGLSQDIKRRSADTTRIELIAGQTYTLTFKAFAADGSVGKNFTCGIHNVNLEDGEIHEQYWTRNPAFVLTDTPTVYRFSFVPTVDGSFRIMIGQGLEEVIDAYYTDIKIETGNIATEWSESPEMK